MNRFTQTAPIVLAVMALGLGACSKEPEPAPSAASEVPTELLPEPDATFDPSEAAPDAVAADAIPAALRGRWGLVSADCTSTAGDAKGLLTISADRLRFYESVAELGAVKSASADAVTADFAFTGEGQSWNLQVALSSPDGGKTLVRRDTGPDAAPQPLTYKKCG